MTRVRYTKLVPPDTFVGRFMAYCSHSETPSSYDLWTALWLISVAVGRGIVVARPGAPVHLNLFCVLVAESGVTRKSTAVRRAVAFARGVCGDQSPLIESRITPELLEDNLQKQSKKYGYAYTNIAIDEMVKFLGKERYVEAMPTLLTDLYDSPTLRTGGGSLVRGKTELRNVYVNFLSASTPSWLLRAVNPDVIEGGFTSRVIFVVSEQPKRSAPWPIAPDETLSEHIHLDLRNIQAEAVRIGSISVNSIALKRFSSWYNARDKKRDPFRASFQSREDSHVLRVAALLAINDGGWEIQANHITAAIKVITETREDGAAIFEGSGGSSKLVLGADALRDKLLAAGMAGTTQGKLTAALQRYMNAEHLKTILAIMHELGFVQKFEGIQVERGRPSTLWRATNSLLDSKSLDLIITRVQPN